MKSTRPECRSGVNVSLISGTKILATKPVTSAGRYRFTLRVHSKTTLRVGSDSQLFGLNGICSAVLSPKRTISVV